VQAPTLPETWVAVLGRRDEPTDGVEDYCIFLGRVLERHGLELRRVWVPWADDGWIPALRSLWRTTENSNGHWALLQYTTMAWSRRGFPFGAWIVLELLRRRGLRCAVVFHEALRQTGNRLVDRIRGACQDWVIRRLYSDADRAIFLDPLDKIGWLPKESSKAAFIPIGANLPDGHADEIGDHERNGNPKTVAVFCLSDPPNRDRELGDIAEAMRAVARHGVKARVTFLGRGTEYAGEEIENLFDSTTGEAVNLGLQGGPDLRRILSEADAMLCVRGPLYMRRGSAIAGIACGLPIVAYAGAAEGTPLEEAGVELVPYLDRGALGEALARVLMDDEKLAELRRRSIEAQARHFSWDVIAEKMVNVLKARGKGTPA
jgi:glycosyltransferase involved in cell wall biosynthesis